MSAAAATYSLEESAAAILGSTEPNDVRWLLRRLRTGEFHGFKANRKWRMTQADIDAAIELLRPCRVVPDVPSISGLMSRSRRRMQRSAS